MPYVADATAPATSSVSRTVPNNNDGTHPWSEGAVVVSTMNQLRDPALQTEVINVQNETRKALRASQGVNDAR